MVATKQGNNMITVVLDYANNTADIIKESPDTTDLIQILTALNYDPDNCSVLQVDELTYFNYSEFLKEQQ